MTDYEKLKKMQEELLKASFLRKNVVDDLLNFINVETGNLHKNLYIPEKERDCVYLKAILQELGYQAKYDDSDYNPYHECYCYKIQLEL